MSNPIRIIRLDCWHANWLIYQADGETDDGRVVFVHFRGGRFNVWVGDGPIDDRSSNGEWIIEAESHPEGRPDTITRATLAAWTIGRIEWPDKIDGYHNEPNEGP